MSKQGKSGKPRTAEADVGEPRPQGDREAVVGHAKWRFNRLCARVAMQINSGIRCARIGGLKRTKVCSAALQPPRMRNAFAQNVTIHPLSFCPGTMLRQRSRPSTSACARTRHCGRTCRNIHYDMPACCHSACASHAAADRFARRRGKVQSSPPSSTELLKEAGSRFARRVHLIRYIMQVGRSPMAMPASWRQAAVIGADELLATMSAHG